MNSFTRYFPTQPLQSSPPSSTLEPTSSSFPRASTSRSPPTATEQTVSPPFSIRSISHLQALREQHGEEGEEGWSMAKGELFPPLPWTTDHSTILGSARQKEENVGQRANSGKHRTEFEGGERIGDTRQHRGQMQKGYGQSVYGEDRLPIGSREETKGSNIAALVPTNNLTDSPSLRDLPPQPTTVDRRPSPFPSSSRSNSCETAYFTASECDSYPTRTRQNSRSYSIPVPQNQPAPISPTSTIRSPSPPPSSFAHTSLSPPYPPARYSRSPDPYPLSLTSLDYDTSFTSPPPFPRHSAFPPSEDPRSLTPMPLDSSFDKPRPVLFRTLPSGDYLPSRSMNRLRGVDEELDPEETAWVEKSRMVRDDGRGRDWWGNPVGMGDWGRTILSPIWTGSEPTSSSRTPVAINQLAFPLSPHQTKTFLRTTPQTSQRPPESRRSPSFSRDRPSLLAQRVEYDRRQAPRPNQDDLDVVSTTASKKEPVSGIAPSLDTLNKHGLEQYSDRGAVGEPIQLADERERERKMEQTRKWARRTAEAYLEQLRAERLAKEREDKETKIIAARGGVAYKDIQEREVMSEQYLDTQSPPPPPPPAHQPTTNPTSTVLLASNRSTAHATPPSCRSFQELPRSPGEEGHRQYQDLDYMASLDYAMADEDHTLPLANRGGHSVPFPPTPNERIRRFESSPNLSSPTPASSTLPNKSVHRLQKPTRVGPIPIPQFAKAELAERRRLRKGETSTEAALPLELTKNSKRKEAWNEWSQFLDRRRNLLDQLGPEPCYEDAPVLNALAQLHFETSNPVTKETAEHFLLQSLQIDPSQPEISSTLAKLLESKDPQSAVQFHRTAFQLDPSNPTFHLRLASALDQSGSEQDSIEVLNEMARTFPSTTWEIVANHRAGMLALRIGETRGAKELLGKARDGLKKPREGGRDGARDGTTPQEMVDIEREVKEGLKELERNRGSENTLNADTPQTQYRRPFANKLRTTRRSSSLPRAASPPPAIYRFANSLLHSPLSNFELPSRTAKQYWSSQAIPKLESRRRDSLASLSSPASTSSASAQVVASQHEAALAHTSLAEALRVLTMISQDRTASQLALETHQVSEAMNAAFQSFRESTQEELEGNEELLRSLQDLCHELELLPEKMIARAQTIDSKSSPTPRHLTLLDPIEEVKGKVGNAKRLLGVLFPSLSQS